MSLQLNFLYYFSSSINWSEISIPLSTNLFEKYTHQSIETPIQSLGLNETLWSQCRSFALNLSQQGFIDPISILYTSFKSYYSSNITLNAFTRWLLLNPTNKNDFSINSLRYPIYQSTDDLLKLCSTSKPLNLSDSFTNLDQIWFFISISILLPPNNCILIPEIIILDNDATRLSLSHKKSSASRLHCLFAITPSGKYSNQLLVTKPGRSLKVNFPSIKSTRIIQTTNGDIFYENIQQWLEDFISSSNITSNSALLIDPRTTLLMPDMEKLNIKILTMDLNSYISNVLSPFLNLFNKKWSEANRISKMKLKTGGEIEHVIYTFWYSLRTLKQNDELNKIFNQTKLWKKNDQDYIELLQNSMKNNLLPKKKKKKILIKISKLFLNLYTNKKNIFLF